MFLISNTPEVVPSDHGKLEPVHLLLAHGAGQPVDSDFFEVLTGGLVKHGVCVHRFEFDYMAARRAGGSRRPPPPVLRLIPEFMAAFDTLCARLKTEAGFERGDTAPDPRIYIGGKSIGGRVASLLADDLFLSGRISGWVGLSYPFHPVKKPTQLRTEHLKEFPCPGIIVQGERDPFGTPDEVSTYGLSPKISLAWLPDGDHDLKPRKRSGHTWTSNLEQAAAKVAGFVRSP